LTFSLPVRYNAAASSKVLSLGDYFQLPPTSGAAPYKSGTNFKSVNGRKFIVDSFKLFIELTNPNFRQKKDPILNELCTAARHCKEPRGPLLDKLNARCTSLAVAKTSVACDALWTASTWSVVNKLNDDHLEQCRKENKPIVNIFAK